VPWTSATARVYPARVLNPTPKAQLVDAKNRPYFLWDEERTRLDEFMQRLADPDPQARAYAIGKLMRQAKPDDVFTFVTKHEIGTLWPMVVIHLGKERAFWEWAMRAWGVLAHETR